MTILCGTDFSPNAADAAVAGAALARRFNDTLELVHATLPPAEEGVSPEVWLPVEGALRQQLDKAATPLRDHGVKVQTRMELGSPTEVLRRLAKPGSTRMIVVSSVGRVALMRVLLGSTADRIAESAPVPTLVVRNAMPFREWMEGRRALRILVAVDLSESSDAALGLTRELAAAGPCEIQAGHVAQEAESFWWPSSASTAPVSRSHSEEELREKIAAQLSPHRFDLAVTPAGQTASEGLIELGKKFRADLIITGAHQHRGLGRLWHHSTSRSLLADAPASVLVVPAQARSLARTRIPPLNRVLVATDLSPLGNLAIPAACALLPLGGTLRILHVVPPVERAFHLIGGKARRPVLSPGEHKGLIEHARRKLASLFPAEAVQRRITPEIVVAVDEDVASAIIRAADDFGAHTVCLSSHGRGAAFAAVLGSVGQKVVAGTHRPVHVVRPRPA